MARPSKTDQELGLLRSYWDTCGVIEGEYNGVTSLMVTRTRRPGICVYRVVFAPLVGDATNYLGSAAVQFEYPNGAAQTLAGALWKASLDLQSTVADAFLEAKRRAPKKG